MLTPESTAAGAARWCRTGGNQNSRHALSIPTNTSRPPAPPSLVFFPISRHSVRLLPHPYPRPPPALTIIRHCWFAFSLFLSDFLFIPPSLTPNSLTARLSRLPPILSFLDLISIQHCGFKHIRSLAGTNVNADDRCGGRVSGYSSHITASRGGERATFRERHGAWLPDACHA